MAKILIATLMIRNEEAIIGRCMESLTGHVDAICVCDTGSSDNTLNVIQQFKTSRPELPVRIFENEWKNFGHNRSLSFDNTRQFATESTWDFATTYCFVMDADMVSVWGNFSKSNLTDDGHTLLQCSDSLEYSNTRFLRLSVNWKCTGVTHEYWDGAPSSLIPKSALYIQDIGDGGCKADKFQRDKLLLEQGLQEDPANARYMFYLAQTYRDLGEYESAIAMFRRRIKAKSWFEEVWQSAYQLCKVYKTLGDYVRMEYWALRAFAIDNRRSENIYVLVNHFREKGDHHKAWHYLMTGLKIKKPSDLEILLFIEVEVYSRLFRYEKTILNYWLKQDRPASLRELVAYCNDFGCGNVYHNLLHYVDRVQVDQIIDLPAIQDICPFFVPSSVAVISNSQSYLLNLRFVNYRIDQSTGAYNMIDGGSTVRTRNFAMTVDTNWKALEGPREMIVEEGSGLVRQEVNILGLEDIRLYGEEPRAVPEEPHAVPVRFSAASLEFSHCNSIRIVTGNYDMDSGTLSNLQVQVPPLGETPCEKNWIFTSPSQFIYKWHPLTICSAENSESISRTAVVSSTETPRFFENVRGSSNIVVSPLFGNITVVHVVQYMDPRKYFHLIVRLSDDFRQVVAYSDPFFFFANQIEYVLGCVADSESKISVLVSQYDSSPSVVCIDLKKITFSKI